jgi:uncharacterized protein with HEPN domain
VDGVSQEDFLKDLKTQDAVLLRLMVIGEAGARLTPDTVALFETISFSENGGPAQAGGPRLRQD